MQLLRNLTALLLLAACGTAVAAQQAHAPVLDDFLEEPRHFESPPPVLSAVNLGAIEWGGMFGGIFSEMKGFDKTGRQDQLSHLWPRNFAVGVCFLTPSYVRGEPLAEHKRRIERVVAIAMRWNEVKVPVRFDFGEDASGRGCAGSRAPVRVHLNDNAENWSRYGNEALTARGPAGETLGLSNATIDSNEGPGTILHEFGHAMGLIHEHQRPAPRGCAQDYEDGMLAHYMSRYNWSLTEATAQLMPRTDIPGNANRAFEPRSVMMYQLPAEFLKSDRCKIAARSNDIHPGDVAALRAAYSKS